MILVLHLVQPQQQVAALRDLSNKVQRSNKLTAADPVLVEYGRENGTDGDVIDVDVTEK